MDNVGKTTMSLPFVDIPYSFTRLALDQIIENNDLQQLSHLGGIEMVKEGTAYHPKYRCAQWVFWGELNEPAFTGLMVVSEKLWTEPIPFMEELSYVPINNPQEGDVLFYGTQNVNGDFRAEHVGLYRGGTIVSKFGRHHVFRHEITRVPQTFGNKGVFLRKMDLQVLTATLPDAKTLS